MNITLRKQERRGRREWIIDFTPPGGKRTRQIFKSKSLAESEMESLRQQQITAGTIWLTLSAQERSEVVSVFLDAKTAGVGLRTVWEDWRTRKRGGITRKTIADAIEELITAKNAANRRERYTKNLKSVLNHFARGREASMVDDFTQSDVVTFISRCKQPGSRSTFLNRLNTLFDFCRRKGYIAANPCQQVERITIEAGTPLVLSLIKSAKCLIWAAKQRPDFLGWLSLALLAGSRPEETDKITWSHVDLDAGLVKIDAAVAKVRQRRITTLTPAAKAWLSLAKRLGSTLPIPHSTRRRHQRALRKFLRFEAWPKDVLRHTAASHLIAHHQDAAKVAHELGNSPGVLLRHYRALVTRADGKKFFKLCPSRRLLDRLA